MFFSRQNSLFQNTKEKFGGTKFYFANERGPALTISPSNAVTNEPL
jgi:hypothetical protein